MWIKYGCFIALMFATATATATTALAESEPDCSRPSGSLPNPAARPGTPNPDIPIEHVLVIMQENHSFDNFFGRLNRPDYYGADVDGVIPGRDFNLDSKGNPVRPYKLKAYCVKDTDHSWDTSHDDYNFGAMDGFVRNNDGKKMDGFRVMGYYEPEDMPYNYALADTFAISDRYFSSLLGPTYPNRYFMMTATAFGKVKNNMPVPFKGWKQKTIFEQLNEAGVSWKYYFSDLPILALFSPMLVKNLKHVSTIKQYYKDLKKGNLPQVAFIESSVLMGDEHPPFNFQISQYYVAKRINALMKSPYWKKSALFLTYDEGGGYYDHVAPPKACQPDGIPPELGKGGSYPADYDRLGFRVPFVAVSPYAKRHYVSHTTYDHTSILKFIETKFNVPALTRRDANADAMLDLFDFARPDFSVPAMPKPKVSVTKLLACLNPFKKLERPAPEKDDLKSLSRQLGLVAQAGEEDQTD